MALLHDCTGQSAFGKWIESALFGHQIVRVKALWGNDMTQVLTECGTKKPLN
ncbi:MAG: hypothetical protein Q4B71_01595 [Cardiobacteriaceae bacterium]|nr:hypothetical protein [Cardiobacteriaceae bacterium]